MSDDATDFLYPFIEGHERNADALVADLTASATAKQAESSGLRAATLAAAAPRLQAAAAAMARRLGCGGRLFTFGNGGSATDAQGVADIFRSPPAFGGRPARSLPAMSLVDDQAVVTALANDVGFDLTYSRQLIAHARAGDVAMGLSTSGNSDNVLRALAYARAAGLLTVGLAGHGGGAMASGPAVDHCFVVASDRVHRIQETHHSLVYALWSLVQGELAPRQLPDGAPRWSDRPEGSMP